MDSADSPACVRPYGVHAERFEPFGRIAMRKNNGNNNVLGNINLFPVAALAAVAALSGILTIGCSGDEPYCEAVAAGGDYSRCDCYDEDGEKNYSKVFLPGDTSVPGECFIPPKDGTTPDNCVPHAEEICDGVDNDCDRMVDEGNVCGTCPSCPECDSCPDCTCDNDCNCTCPTNPPPSCQPSQEVCNGHDDDCDGLVDEGDVCGSNPPPTGTWQVLAMGIEPSDPLLTCNGQPIIPSASCAGTIGWNRSWLENRSAAVYSGAYTNLSLLGGAGYSEAFNGLLGAYCAVEQSAACGPNVHVSGLPVAAGIKLANGTAYGEGASVVDIAFESVDNCATAVVCSLSVDRYAFWQDGQSMPMSLNLADLETKEELLAYKVSISNFSPEVRAFLLSQAE